MEVADSAAKHLRSATVTEPTIGTALSGLTSAPNFQRTRALPTAFRTLGSAELRPNTSQHSGAARPQMLRNTGLYKVVPAQHGRARSNAALAYKTVAPRSVTK